MRGSGASTRSMSPNQARATAFVSGLTIRSSVNFTSALVTGSPLWNFAGRSRNEICLPSGEMVQLSARSGWTRTSGPSRVRVLYTSSNTRWLVNAGTLWGSRFVASPWRASVSDAAPLGRLGVDAAHDGDDEGKPERGRPAAVRVRVMLGSSRLTTMGCAVPVSTAAGAPCGPELDDQAVPQPYFAMDRARTSREQASRAGARTRARPE